VTRREMQWTAALPADMKELIDSLDVNPPPSRPSP
jgi:hypothetical protein